MAERINNKIVERIYATGVWRSRTALHLGGESDNLEHNVDMTLLRDSDGRFFVLGSSIAGAARSHLASRVLPRGAYQQGLEKEPAVMQALFGKKYASALTFFDAPCISSAAAVVRDGVAIEPETGTADDGAKYNFEVLPAGVSFQFAILLLRYETLPLKVDEKELLQYFRAVLEAFSRGEIRLGAKTQRGLGEGKVDKWSVHRLQMSMPEHVEAWLDQDWPRVESLGVESLSPEPLGEDLRKRLVIHADFAVKTSVLMRAPGAQAGAPDMVHHTENDGEKDTPLIAGTGLAGAFLNRVERIANTMVPNAREALKNLFRPLKKEHGADAAEGVPEHKSFRRSPIAISEGPLSAGDLMVQGRNAIDRFTGGTVSGALFDEAAFWPDSSEKLNWRFSLTLDIDGDDIKRRKPYEAAVVLQVFKDLWLGDLPIGGEKGVGRGVMRGLYAEFQYPGLDRLILEAVKPAGKTAEDAIVVKQGDWKEWNKLAELPGHSNALREDSHHGQG